MARVCFSYMIIAAFTIFTLTDSVVGQCSPGYFKCDKERMCFANKYKCDGHQHCPDGSDEIHCKDYKKVKPETTPVTTCPEGFFKCGQGGCLNSTYRCDGYNHCGDNSDEIDCVEQNCPEKYFDCGDNLCIPIKYQCDQKTHCPSSQDEIDCKLIGPNVNNGRSNMFDEITCPKTEFKCRKGGCLLLKYKCDGFNHCGDRSDEEFCDRDPCPPNSEPCDNYGCYDTSLKCDGINHCPDGSDEKNCVSKCPTGYIGCKSNNLCIIPQYKCDGKADCQDGTDENNCMSGCSDIEFRCDSGLCIPKAQRCDSINQCDDFSDEFRCQSACPKSYFTCDSASCVRKDNLCDGVSDCKNNLDENHCQKGCPKDYFKCKTHVGCILNKYVCDRTADCPDRSDEKDCSNFKCNHGQFLCDISTCVSMAKRCDGKLHCWDGTDEINCVERCTDMEFTCNHGGCIPNFLRCDGIKHCGDFSDELNCAGIEDNIKSIIEEDKIPCYKQDVNYFSCLNGRCIPSKFKCDGFLHCEDGSDETNCKTICEGSYKCAGGGCIEPELRCNGHFDCFDQSDEIDCQTSDCPIRYFRCNTGGCIPPRYRCDGYVQCSDGTDELNCKEAELQRFYKDDTRRKRSTISVTDPDEKKQARNDENTDHLPPRTHSNVGNRLPRQAPPRIGRGKRPGKSEKRIFTVVIPCDEDEFECGDEKCIDKKQVCDGIEQCAKGTDEKDCKMTTTSSPIADKNTTNKQVHNESLPKQGKSASGNSTESKMKVLIVNSFTFINVDIP